MEGESEKKEESNTEIIDKKEEPNEDRQESTSHDNVLEKRQKNLLKNLKGKQTWIAFILLAIIAYVGYFIRTRNLGYLTDVTNGEYIPLALDPFAFLRYVKFLLENGYLMAVDTMRYVPFGYDNISEFSFLSHFVVYMYKIWSFFVPSITIEYVHVMYPVVAFVIGLVFFFLFVKEVFDWKVALLSSAFLTVLPAYLYRTMAGFSDKEAAAMMFMFFALFMFVKYVKEKKLTKKLIYSALAGVGVACMGLIWGGVSFVFLIIGGFVFLSVFFGRFEDKDFYGYLLLLVLFYLILQA